MVRKVNKSLQIFINKKWLTNLINFYKCSKMLTNLHDWAGITPELMAGRSLIIILFRLDGRMAYSDNNATQPAGAGLWLSLAIFCLKTFCTVVLDLKSQKFPRSDIYDKSYYQKRGFVPFSQKLHLSVRDARIILHLYL